MVIYYGDIYFLFIVVQPKGSGRLFSNLSEVEAVTNCDLLSSEGFPSKLYYWFVLGGEKCLCCLLKPFFHTVSAELNTQKCLILYQGPEFKVALICLFSEGCNIDNTSMQ